MPVPVVLLRVYGVLRLQEAVRVRKHRWAHYLSLRIEWGTSGGTN